MRTLLLGLFLLQPLTGAVAFVQGKTCGAASPIPCTFTSPVTAGNTIKVGTIEFGVSAPTVTDSQGNTYTARLTAASGGAIVILTATASSTGSLTVTLTRSGTFSVGIAEFSSTSPSSLDGTTSGSGHPFGNTLASVGFLTTTISTDLIFCAFRDDSGSGAYADGFWDGGGFATMHVIAGSTGGVGIGYSIPAAALSNLRGYYAVSGSSGSGGCAAFQEAAAVIPNVKHRVVGGQ